MWTYVLGPIVALLPARWRKALPFAEAANWGVAGTLSGLGEFAVAIAGIICWYSYSMTTWVQRGLDYALSGKQGSAEITDHAIGLMAYAIWATHPLTWILGYFFAEGAVRLCGAAFTGSILGTLPLFLADKAYGKIFRRGEPKDAVAANAPAGSFGSAMRDKMLSARPVVGDELSIEKDGNEELLQVRASRRKAEWEPPKVVRYKDSYYRLESCSRGGGARPFQYTLRKLPAGVPGRTVLVYSPE
jgi:hypothetical protein